MHREVSIALVVSGLTLWGCATTVHDSASAQTWRSSSPTAVHGSSNDGQLRVHVVAFGLSPGVARRYPELVEGAAGWGVCQRIAESLYDSGLFVFVEEKAEVVGRMVGMARGMTGEEVEPVQGVQWLLYGEVVDLLVERTERVVGLSGMTEERTAVSIQVRLVDRATHRIVPATARGQYTAKVTARRDDGALDANSVGLASDEAVKAACAQLLQQLGTAR